MKQRGYIEQPNKGNVTAFHFLFILTARQFYAACSGCRFRIVSVSINLQKSLWRHTLFPRATRQTF